MAYPLSRRHIEEMMLKRGVCVDHATMDRWLGNQDGADAEIRHIYAVLHNR